MFLFYQVISMVELKLQTLSLEQQQKWKLFFFWSLVKRLGVCAIHAWARDLGRVYLHNLDCLLFESQFSGILPSLSSGCSCSELSPVVFHLKKTECFLSNYSLLPQQLQNVIRLKAIKMWSKLLPITFLQVSTPFHNPLLSTL